MTGPITMIEPVPGACGEAERRAVLMCRICWLPRVWRLPLADGAERWREFLAIAAGATGDRYAMLEFVERDAPECFLRDAATLKSWLIP